jgi:YidC/Oxa1 family membrane protein insertase
MKLYREYGVNPMGGCLPMLVQIPIFFGVFNMINAAVELRGQPFLWVKDLSQPDHLTDIFGLPLNLLPILMAVTMVIQMRMTPQTGDKLQRRIFMLMPLMFFVFCYNYASALALYWTTQNIVSIGQTWLTQRMPEPELAKKVAKGAKKLHADNEKPRKKGFMERMAEKLEEAQNQRDAAAGKAPLKEKKIPGQTAEKKPKKRTPKTGG